VIDTEEYFRISSLCALWLGKISCGYGNIPARARAYVFPVRYEERVQNLLNCLSLLGPLGISFDAPDKMEPLKYSEEDRDKADAFLVPYAQDMFKIALHSGGAETAPERFWSAKNWVELCERLVAEYGSNVRIFLTGTEFERAQVEKIFAAVSPEASERMVNVCGAFGIFPFARFLERMDVVVSNDTGPMHLAAAMGTPTIGLFGPDIPEAFGPYPPDRNVALYHGEGKNYLRVHLGEYETPPPGLVDLIGVGEVMEAVSKFL
jgi:heptosyltransferase-2